MSGFVIAVISIITSVLGVYVAASFTLAQKQLLAATRLRAYLLYYARVAIDMDWFKILYLGQQWDNEEMDILRNGGKAAELQALREEKKRLCDKIVDAMKNPESVTDSSVAAVKQSFPTSAEELSLFIELMKAGRQNLLTGQTFITDEEAAYLGTYAALHAIALKTGYVELMDGVVVIFTRHSRKEQPLDTSALLADFSRYFWRMMNIALDYSRLQRVSETVANSPVLKLTWKNIRQGSRISRR